MEKDFKEIADKASLVLKIGNGSMRVNSKFRLLNRFNIGIFLFLTCSTFVITISILKTNGVDLVIGLFIGIGLLIISFVQIAKQITDFLFVTDKEIVFRNSLRKRTIQIRSDLKVKTLIERKHVNTARVGAGSYSRTVELFIEKDKIKYRVFDFIMEDESTKEVDTLSKKIAHFIKRKIEDSVAEKN